MIAHHTTSRSSSDVFDDGRSFSRVLRDVRDDAMSLVRQELRLFQVEMKENVAAALRHGIMLAAGGMVAVMAANMLILAVTVGLVVLLNAFMPLQAAVILGPLVMAVALGVTGWLLIQRGLHCLKNTNFKPERTIAAARETKQWIAHQT